MKRDPRMVVAGLLSVLLGACAPKKFTIVANTTAEFLCSSDGSKEVARALEVENRVGRAPRADDLPGATEQEWKSVFFLLDERFRIKRLEPRNFLIIGHTFNGMEVIPYDLSVLDSDDKTYELFVENVQKKVNRKCPHNALNNQVEQILHSLMLF